MLERRSKGPRTIAVCGLGWRAVCLLLVSMVSCNNAQKDRRKGTDVREASSQPCALRSPSAGEWFSDDLAVTVVGQYGHKLRLDQIRFVSVQARDAQDRILPWRIDTRPDSKFGPMASIVVSPAGASGKKIVVEASLKYRGQPIAVRAEFTQGENGRDWKATTVVVQNAE